MNEDVALGKISTSQYQPRFSSIDSGDSQDNCPPEYLDPCDFKAERTLGSSFSLLSAATSSMMLPATDASPYVGYPGYISGSQGIVSVHSSSHSITAPAYYEYDNGYEESIAAS